jgi:DNA-binding response OmpR family regulator
MDQGDDNVTPDCSPHSGLQDDQAKRPYIVIVEDDDALARLLCEVFARGGNRCFAIRSKTSAEQFLRQVRPDLVVVDYQLVGGIGLEAAQIASDKNVPVIITSGYLDILDRVKKAGYFYLRKPFAPTDLLNLASMALGIDLASSDHRSIQLH